MGLLISGGGCRGGFGAAHLFLLIIGVSWFCSSGVEGLKCYDCQPDNKDCNNDNPQRNCPSRVEFCLKADGQLDGKKMILKGCNEKSGRKEGCSNVDEAGFKGEVCYCKTDLCNTSAKKYPPSLMILLAASTLTQRR